MLQNDVEDALFWCSLLVLLVGCHVFCKYRFFVVDSEYLLICGLIFGGCELQACGLMKVDKNMLVDAH